MHNFKHSANIKLTTLITVSFLVHAINNLSVNAHAEADSGRHNNSIKQLHPNISSVVPAWCKKTDSCKDLLVIDCLASNDGPLYYFNNATGKLLMKCGGYCLRPKDYVKQPLECKQCPPTEWLQCTKSK